MSSPAFSGQILSCHPERVTVLDRPEATPDPRRRAISPAPKTGWGALFRDTAGARVAHRERDALVARYAPLLVPRPDLGRLVGPKLGLTRPIHRWFFYKEAYSPDLVDAVLTHWDMAPGRLLDPFAGVGTTLLAAADRGWNTTGVEFLPVSTFVAQTKGVAHSADPARVAEGAVQAVREALAPGTPFPDFNIVEKAFDPPVLTRLLGLHEAVLRQEPGVERDLLRLALLSVVEGVSHATKDGTSLRFQPPGHRRGRFGVQREAADVDRAFLNKCREIIADLGAPLLTTPEEPRGEARCQMGDAREVGELFAPGSFHAVVTSPPYPNRYDYTANYQLELGLGFVASREELKSLRKGQLRSHVECPWPEHKTVELPALEELLRTLLHKGMSTTRVFRMLAGYFEDMAKVLRGLHRVLAPGGRAALNVGNVQFSGEPVLVDLLLAELARQVGFTVEGLWVARLKGRTVQQQQQYGMDKSRESVLLLQKAG